MFFFHKNKEKVFTIFIYFFALRYSFYICKHLLFTYHFLNKLRIKRKICECKNSKISSFAQVNERKP